MTTKDQDARPQDQQPRPVRFEVGDEVQWTSQSHGYRRTKLGKIVAIVAAGYRPSVEDWPELHKGAGCGYARNHDSYIVRANGRIYWPRVATLHRPAGR